MDTTRETKEGGGHVRGDVRGGTESEVGGKRERGEGEGIGGESSRRGVYLYSESCGMPRKWNNQ